MQNLARGVKICQLPLLYFTPLVTNIGESLSRATPVFVQHWIVILFSFVVVE